MVTDKPAASLHRRAIEKAPPAESGAKFATLEFAGERQTTTKRRAAKLFLCQRMLPGEGPGPTPVPGELILFWPVLPGG